MYGIHRYTWSSPQYELPHFWPCYYCEYWTSRQLTTMDHPHLFSTAKIWKELELHQRMGSSSSYKVEFNRAYPPSKGTRDISHSNIRNIYIYSCCLRQTHLKVLLLKSKIFAYKHTCLCSYIATTIKTQNIELITTLVDLTFLLYTYIVSGWIIRIH